MDRWMLSNSQIYMINTLWRWLLSKIFNWLLKNPPPPIRLPLWSCLGRKRLHSYQGQMCHVKSNYQHLEKRGCHARNPLGLEHHHIKPPPSQIYFLLSRVSQCPSHHQGIKGPTFLHKCHIEPVSQKQQSLTSHSTLDQCITRLLPQLVWQAPLIWPRPL